jgi:adenylate kinase
MASAEEIAVQALQAVAALTVYADEAPDSPSLPYAVYQAVGGQDITDLDNDPDNLQNCRLQLAIWSEDKAESVAMMQQSRRALMLAGASPIGAPVSVWERETKRFGRRLDFSIWFKE